MTAQESAMAKCEARGFRFSNWVPAQPDANNEGMDDQQSAVMIKRSRHGSEYCEVSPDGSIN